MKKKFNIFDAVIILAVIGLIIGVVLKFCVLPDTAVTSAAQTESTQVTYTVKLTEVRQYIVDIFQTGDDLYLSANTADDETVKVTKIISEELASYGTITDIQVKPAAVSILKDDGTVAAGVCHERYDIILTVTAPGEIGEDGIVKVNGYNLMVNKKFPFYTKYYGNTGTISSITTAA